MTVPPTTIAPDESGRGLLTVFATLLLGFTVGWYYSRAMHEPVVIRPKAVIYEGSRPIAWE